MKYVVLLISGLLTTGVSASDGTQTAYHLALISAMFGFFDIFFFTIGLILFIVLLIGLFNTVTAEKNKNLMQSMDRSPVTVFRFIMGLVILSGFLFTPMRMASLGGDLVAKDSGNACIVVDVDENVKQFKSDKSSSDCFQKMLNDLGGIIDTSEFNQSKMRIFLASVQLIAVGFMAFGASMFVLNMAGFKNLSLTPSKAVGVMFASTIVFAAPSLIAYAVEVFKGSQTLLKMAP